MNINGWRFRDSRMARFLLGMLGVESPSSQLLTTSKQKHLVTWSSSPLPKNVIPLTGKPSSFGMELDRKSERRLQAYSRLTHGTTFICIESEPIVFSSLTSNAWLVLENGQRIFCRYQQRIDGYYYLLLPETTGSTTSQSSSPTDSTRTEPSFCGTMSCSLDTQSSLRLNGTLVSDGSLDFGTISSCRCPSCVTLHAMLQQYWSITIERD